MNDFLNLYDIILYTGFYPWLKELKLDCSKGVRYSKAQFALLVENEGKGFLNGFTNERRLYPSRPNCGTLFHRGPRLAEPESSKGRMWG